MLSKKTASALLMIIASCQSPLTFGYQDNDSIPMAIAPESLELGSGDLEPLPSEKFDPADSSRLQLSGKSDLVPAESVQPTSDATVFQYSQGDFSFGQGELSTGNFYPEDQDSPISSEIFGEMEREQFSLLNEFHPTHQHVGRLEVSNIPFGVWLEVEGRFFQFTGKLGLSSVLISVPVAAPRTTIAPTTIVLRSGRSPRQIRNGEGRSAEITLLPDQEVRFDWTREFGDLNIPQNHFTSMRIPYVKPYRSETSALEVLPDVLPDLATPQPLPNPPIARSGFAVEFDGDCQPLEVRVKSTLEMEAIVNLPDGETHFLTLKTDLASLPMLKRECVVVANAKVKFTNAAGTETTVSQELELPLAVTKILKINTDNTVLLELSTNVTSLKSAYEKSTFLKQFFAEVSPKTRANLIVWIDLEAASVRFVNSFESAGIKVAPVTTPVTGGSPRIRLEFVNP